MSNITRVNRILVSLYLFATVIVFAAAMFFPAFRVIAYAPLRELVLPPPAPVVVSVLYSTEKEAWLDQAIIEFERTRPTVNGHPVQIALEKMGSREIYLAVLDGSRKPDVVSPASMLQISILQDQSAGVFGRPVVNMADTEACRPVVTTPLVLVAWKERADVLWGARPPRDVWKQLQRSVVDAQGWATLGRAEWGYVKFGHTDPLKSNSGFMTVLLMTYDYYGKTSGLRAEDILSNAEYQDWFIGFEKNISEFEYSTGPLMQKMVSYGPSTYDLVTVYEATAIEQAENAVGRYGELRVYYPPATVWSDHPFCVLEADWVTGDKRAAAKLFIDYLASKPAQELALLEYGFRPVDASIPLGQAGSPFTVYAANGFQADLSSLPTVETPPGNVLNTLLDFWARNAAR
ncbi:MAG: substrate-binding domain-containing protein [Chloroflexota bacterium]